MVIRPSVKTSIHMISKQTCPNFLPPKVPSSNRGPHGSKDSSKYFAPADAPIFSFSLIPRWPYDFFLRLAIPPSGNDKHHLGFSFFQGRSQATPLEFVVGIGNHPESSFQQRYLSKRLSFCTTLMEKVLH